MIGVAIYFDRKLNQAMKNENKQVNIQRWKYRALSIGINSTSIGLLFTILFTSNFSQFENKIRKKKYIYIDLLEFLDFLLSILYLN
jgi:hypothetical protein